MEVIWHRKAQEQFENAMDYCLKQFGRRAAKRIVDKIDKDVLLLSANPYMEAIEESLQKLAEFRYIVEGPAKLIYTVEDGYIFIHLYWDCRQDPGHLMELIKDVD
ncbi:type II toxin-antitoxin system RelE/ParE family toxin [Parabacteroides johnsonii]|uniref:type II toxin-antitoxin system RelE/ParE family toxin n=1 Tax=Parabacteroides johnsonii TaxID=387661 RepID=UPI001652B552|nr:type II toxin-antitoxin system RelE/ParE family toxin [Parabacteroides johnsonii]